MSDLNHLRDNINNESNNSLYREVNEMASMDQDAYDNGFDDGFDDGFKDGVSKSEQKNRDDNIKHFSATASRIVTELKMPLEKAIELIDMPPELKQEVLSEAKKRLAI